jgi:hypothetical protein
MRFFQALQLSEKKLEVYFEESNLFKHSGEKGEFREQIISKLIRPFLPKCYGLGTGEIFSLDGNSSNQIDIVIYDALFSNILLKNEQSCLFPCESVYGEIEVKSNLSSSELTQSLDNIASMKGLTRQDSSMLDITPIMRINISNHCVVQIKS